MTGVEWNPEFVAMLPPLFIPLRAQYYDAFENGTKTCELHRYGPRWNEGTCVLGRRAVLSKGYGKAHRLVAVVTAFSKALPAELAPSDRLAATLIYGDEDFSLAVIGLDVTGAA